jgi:hypothetical protein
MGLTPRQYQSGEADGSGRISRCGDIPARTLMYEAAVVILTRVKRASSLKGLGADDRKAIRLWQSPSGLAKEAVRHPAEHKALGRGLSLVGTPGAQLRSSDETPLGSSPDGGTSCPPGRGYRTTATEADRPLGYEPVLDIAPVVRIRCCGGTRRPWREP